MTVSIYDTRVLFAGAGSVGPYTFPFAIQDDDDLVVIKSDTSLTETVLTIDVDYTVSYVTGATSGTVTLMTALATGYNLLIMRNTDQLQESDYVEHDPFAADTHETALDKLLMEVQELNEKVGRAIQYKRSGTLKNDYYPKPVPYYLLGWNAAGTGITHYPPSSGTGGSGGGTDRWVFIEDYSDSLETAILAFPTNRVTLVIDKAITLVDAAVVVPENIELFFTSDGSLVGTGTLVINGQVRAASTQLFSGGVTVTFGGQLLHVMADWFGDDSAAIALAWAANLNGSVVLTPNKDYSGNLTLSGNTYKRLLDGNGAVITGNLYVNKVKRTAIRNIEVNGYWEVRGSWDSLYEDIIVKPADSTPASQNNTPASGYHLLVTDTNTVTESPAASGKYSGFGTYRNTFRRVTAKGCILGPGAYGSTRMNGVNSNLFDECIFDWSLSDGTDTYTDTQGAAILVHDFSPNANPGAWSADHAFAVGEWIAPTVPNARIYVVVAVTGDAKSGAVEPTWDDTINSNTVDDAVTWKCFKTYNGANVQNNHFIISNLTHCEYGVKNDTTWPVLLTGPYVELVTYANDGPAVKYSDGYLTSGDDWDNPSDWVADTVYSVGDLVVPTVPNGYMYRVTSRTSPYASGSAEPTWGTTPDGTTADNDLTWTCYLEGGDTYGPQIDRDLNQTYSALNKGVTGGHFYPFVDLYGNPWFGKLKYNSTISDYAPLGVGAGTNKLCGDPTLTGSSLEMVVDATSGNPYGMVLKATGGTAADGCVRFTGEHTATSSIPLGRITASALIKGTIGGSVIGHASNESSYHVLKGKASASTYAPYYGALSRAKTDAEVVGVPYIEIIVTAGTTIYISMVSLHAGRVNSLNGTYFPYRRQITTGQTAAPTTGNWLTGDFVRWNSMGTAQGAPYGWLCTDDDPVTFRELGQMGMRDYDSGGNPNVDTVAPRHTREVMINTTGGGTRAWRNTDGTTTGWQLDTVAVYTQDAEPTIPATSLAIWRDTNDSNKLWLMVNIAGTAKKIEIPT